MLLLLSLLAAAVCPSSFLNFLQKLTNRHLPHGFYEEQLRGKRETSGKSERENKREIGERGRFQIDALPSVQRERRRKKTQPRPPSLSPSPLPNKPKKTSKKATSPSSAPSPASASRASRRPGSPSPTPSWSLPTRPSPRSPPTRWTATSCFRSGSR